MREHAVESEFKLAAPGVVDAEALRLAWVDLGLKSRLPANLVQRDLYVDTAGFDLYRQGFGLRMRTSPRQSLVTLKRAAPAVDGLHQRLEIEVPYTGPWPPTGASALPGSIRDAVEPFIWDRPLVALVTLVTERSVHGLEAPSVGALAELAIDRVEVTGPAGERSEFREVEIEFDASAMPPFPAAALADAVRQRCGLTPSHHDKLHRALESIGVAVPDKAARPLEAGMAIEMAALQILSRHFDRIQQHEAGARLGEDAEELHDMRVGTRRLRAAMRSFKGALGNAITDRRSAIIRDTAGMLGSVRDLDVLLEEWPELIAELPQELTADFMPFLSLVHGEHERRRARLLAWLRSASRLRGTRRFSEALVKAAAALDGGGFTVGQVAPGMLLEAARRALKKGRKVDESSPAERLHDLRIALKRLRYGCDAFVDIYGKPLVTYSKRIAELQDVLGAFCDAHTQLTFLMERADKSAKRLSKRTLVAVGALAGALASRERHARAAFADAWRAFAADEVQHCLTRALTE